MSVNPTGGDLPPNVAALIAQELASLANDAQTLAARLVPGDIVDATVLPSNGLTDLLDIGGLRVAAELPPTLVPGEAIRVLVTGLDGERINLQLLSESPSAPANQPVPAEMNPSPSAAAAAAFGGAAPPPAVLSLSALPDPTAGGAAAASAVSSVVAAEPPVASDSTIGSLGPPNREAGAAMPPSASGNVGARSGTGDTGPAASSMPPAREPPLVQPTPGRPALPPLSGYFAASPVAPSSARPPAPVILQSIEARLAAAHAAAAPVTRAPIPPLAPRAPVPIETRSAAPAPSRPPAASAPSRPLAAPAPSRPPTASAASRPPGSPTEPRQPGSSSTAAGSARSAGPAGAPEAVATPRAQPVSPRTAGATLTRSVPNEPAALLRALRLPVTAANAAAARIALESPEKLLDVLAALERSTSDGSDPRVATINTLASFLARLDPRSPVFAAQIAAFVDHVVTGPEARLAQLALLASPATGAMDDESNAPSATTARPANDSEPNAPPQLPAAATFAPPEQLAGVRTALEYDLKTQLLALAADRSGAPSAATPSRGELDRVVAGALCAITATQFGALAALREHPNGLTFTLPLALPDGAGQAQVRIDRDAPGARNVPLDGDNFHIAFVLSTKHLGTVAIDLVTVGRAVSLSIKTEAVRAQQRFGDALGGLRTRLEGLRYHVAAADAVVAPAAPAGPTPAQVVAGDPSARPASAGNPSARPASAGDAAPLVDIEA